MAFNSDRCLKFICVENPVTINMRTSSIDSSHYKFSKDGATWVNDTITLQPGEYAYCRGTNYPSKRDASACFTMSGTGFVDLDGNIMSLVDDGAGSQLSISRTEAFWKLFASCNQIRNILNPLLLPATTLADYCYTFVFFGCKNLEIPDDFVLPCIDLPQGCYCNMFQESGIKKVPKSLFGYVKNYRDTAYSAMFYGCERLTVIEYPHRYFMNVSEGHRNWVGGPLPAKGTFYCLWSMFNVAKDANHVPPGWDIKPLYEFDPNKCLKVTCFTGSFDTAINPSVHYGEKYQFSKDGVNWVADGIHLTAGEFAYIKGMNAPSASTTSFRVLQVNNPSADLTFGVSGHITSLVDGVGEDLTSKVADWGFNQFFSQCGKYLVSVSPDLINLTHNTYHLYYCLFQGCTGLTEIPEDFLYESTKNNDPWTGLYESFFNGCTGLTKLPEKLLVNLTRINPPEILRGFAIGCSNLNELTVYFNDWGDTSSINSTYLWLQNVAPTGTLHCPGQLPKTRGASYIPTGWNIVDSFNPDKCLKFTCSEAQVTISIPASKVDTLQHYYFSKDGSTWTADTITLQPGESAYCRGNDYPTINPSNATSFTMSGSGKIAVSGNLLSMVDNGVGEQAEITAEYGFYRLFYQCTPITEVDKEFFVSSAENMADFSYQSLFEGCSNLKRIRVPFTEWPETATKEWVINVPTSGAFYADEELPRIMDVSHIPIGWEDKPLFTKLPSFSIFGKLKGKAISFKDVVNFNGSHTPLNRDSEATDRPKPTPVTPTTLLPGSTIKAMREALVSATSINEIKFAKLSTFPSSAVTISVDGAATPVKMWFEQAGGVLKIGSISDHIYANENMGGFFQNLPNCARADISWVDMSTAKNINGFVYEFGTNLSESFIHGFDRMDLSGVTNTKIFVWNSSLKIQKGAVFNFKSLEDGSNTCLFGHATNLTDDILKTLKFKFPKLYILHGYNETQGLFVDCPFTEFPAGVFEFGTNLTGKIATLFVSMPNLKKLDLSDWPVKLPAPASSTQQIAAFRVFCNNPALTEINLSGWDIYNANSVGGFFYGCTSLQTVYVDENWRDNDHPSSYFITGSADMIYNCPSMVGQCGHNLGSAGVGIPAWMKVDKPTMNGILTCKYKNAEAELLNGNDFNIALKKACNFTSPTPATQQATVTSIVKRETALPGSQFFQVVSSNTTGPKVYACLSSDNKTLQFISEAKDGKIFGHYSNVVSGDLDYVTSNSTCDMFRGFTLAQTIDISWIDFSRMQVTGPHMFYDCHALTAVPGLESVDFSGSGRKDFTDKRHITHMQSMFRYCHSLPDSIITQMNQANIKHIVETYVAFEECNSLFNVDVRWDFSGLTITSDCRRMFYNCTKLRNVTFAKSKNWVHGGNMAEMFRLCSGLAYVNLSSLTYPANLWAIFAEDGSLYYVDFSNIKSDEILHDSELGAIFWNCYSLQRFYIGDQWVVPAAGAANDTFQNCNNLRSQCGYGIGYLGTGSNRFRSDDVYHHGDYGLGCYKPTTLYPADGNAIIAAIKTKTGSGTSYDAVDDKVKHIVFSDHYECAYGSDVQIADTSLETYTRPDGTLGNLTAPYGTFFRWDATTGTITFFTIAERNYMASNAANLFRRLTAVEDIDMSWLSFDNTRSFGAMFYGDKALKTIIYPEKIELNEDYFADVNYMFEGCSSLEEIDLTFIEGKTGQFEMSAVANGCTNLKSFKAPNIDMQEKRGILVLDHAFVNCPSIKRIDLSPIICTYIRNSQESVFGASTSLTSITMPTLVKDTTYTTNSIDLRNLCANVPSLGSVDFQHWDASNVKLNCFNMFNGCTNLRKIYLPKDPAKWITVDPSVADAAFATGATLLAGDKGTKFSTETNKCKYFVLDNAPQSPGFGSTLREYY